MTKIAQGPSLPQAQGSSNNKHHRHLHSHNLHARHQHIGVDNNNHHHIRLHGNQLHRYAPDQESPTTEVLQTISVVQVIDSTGAIIDVKTILPDSATQLAYPASSVTLDSSTLESAVPTPTLPVSGVPSIDVGITPTTTVATELATESISLSSLSIPETLTSAPSSSSPPFPILSGGYNSTSRPSFSNSTYFHSLFANTTSTSSSASVSVFSLEVTTTSDSSSTFQTSTTEVPPVTVYGGNGNGAGGAGPTSLPTPTSTASDSSDSSPSPPGPTTGAVIGGVVGGVAGIALIALVLLFLVKWKKQQGNGIRLLGDGDGPTRRLSLFSRGGPSGGGGMMERAVPFAVPGALATLTGHRRASQATTDGNDAGEKGFYRVSGRKLTSVLQSGGDGYSDPDENRISGASFRDSIAMFSGPHSPPLQLGSPMRPESGIVIIRSGPARTPVQEQGPFFDEPRLLTPPSIGDPLGRSLISQSGSGVSGGSASRFTEDI